MSKKSELEHLDAKQLVRNATVKVTYPRKKKNVCTRPCTTVKKKMYLWHRGGPEWTNNQRSLTVGLNNVFAAMRWITKFLTFILSRVEFS